MRLLTVVMAAAVAGGGQTARLVIHADQVTGKVSPTLYGLMTEEINHAFDGGLYAELVRNRALKDSMSRPVGWAVRGENSTIAVDAYSGPSAALGSSLWWWAKTADAGHPAGVENSGWWGMEVRPGTKYSGSLWAKSEDAMGPITVALVSNKDGEVAAQAVVEAAGRGWGERAFSLTTGAGVEAGSDYSLLLSVARPGMMRLSEVSLFPPTFAGRANGLRPDLMAKLAAMHPAFLRFPGGNYLEGDTIAERFNWKETIGPLVDRPGHEGPWRYRSSDGMGLLEYLEWCEDLRMQPVLAVYAGYSLRGEHVEPGAALEPFVQDAIDEIEYVTGAPTTRWGGERAKDGHAAPFALQYVEIGNEDNFDRSHSYDGRFAQFYDAIKRAYPKLALIATAKVTSRRPDVVDDHYYYSAERFMNLVHHYDTADRTGPKVMVGEWATEEGRPTPDFGAALSDAAWMTGLERNSDLIVMASYAPLFVNVNPGARQWGTNLIGYDAGSSYESPSYWAQVLFAQHLGTEIVAAELSGAGPRLFYSVTWDGGELDLKIVNADATPAAVDLDILGFPPGDVAREWRLSAATLSDTNSIAAPQAIVPVADSVSGFSRDHRQVFPPYSITVLVIPLALPATTR